MRTFASKEKRLLPATRKSHSYAHHMMGPTQQAQRVEISRILRFTGAQAKLTIGHPNDKYEQEADCIADRVMAMPDPQLQRQTEGEEEEGPVQAKLKDGAMLQLMCAECEDEKAQRQPDETKDEELQAKEQPGHTPQVTPNIAANIQSLKGGGRPLSELTRSFFEPRFVHDFSQVRIHSDAKSASTTKALNARAFTLGQDVVFGPGEYSSSTSSGIKLLAHELTHVVQQSRSNNIIQFQQKIDKNSKYLEIVKDIESKEKKLGTYLRKVRPGMGQTEILFVKIKENQKNYELKFLLEIQLKAGLTSKVEFHPEKVKDKIIDKTIIFTFQMKFLLDPKSYSAVDLYHEGIHMLLYMDELLHGTAKESRFYKTFQKYLAAGKKSPVYTSLKKQWAQIFHLIKLFKGEENKKGEETVNDLIEEKFVNDQEKKEFKSKMSNNVLAQRDFLRRRFLLIKWSQLEQEATKKIITKFEKDIIEKGKKLIDSIDKDLMKSESHKDRSTKSLTKPKP